MQQALQGSSKGCAAMKMNYQAQLAKVTEENEHLKGEIRSLNEALRMQEELFKKYTLKYESDCEEFEKRNRKLSKKNKRLRARVTDLEAALEEEGRRAGRCMDVAEDASSALGNMGRVAFRQLALLEELTIQAKKLA